MIHSHTETNLFIIFVDGLTYIWLDSTNLELGTWKYTSNTICLLTLSGTWSYPDCLVSGKGLDSLENTDIKRSIRILVQPESVKKYNCSK